MKQFELETYVDAAIEEAKIAFKEDEVPVGAVIVKDGKIVARAHNNKENSNDPTAHAEIVCIMAKSVILTKGICRSWPNVIMRSTCLRIIQRREGAKNEGI